MSELRHAYADVNGIRMHYVTAGQGPLVVLLHGFPEFWYSWRKQIPALADHFTVVAPDLRGYNETDRPAWGYELDVLVADVLELIAALGHERAMLVGHDWGGAIAWAAAIAHPHRVERLAILNAPHPAVFLKHLRDNPAQMRRSWYMGFFLLPVLPELAFRANDYAAVEQIFRGTTPPGTFGDEEITAYKDALSKPGVLTAALNYYRAAGRRGARGLFAGPARRCEVPTLLIWGENDIALGAEMLDDIPEFVPDLTVRRLPGVSHWVQHQAPAEVNAALLEFLRRP
ncbi:MAG TPA: alpha/beta hydrolase [Chloroflexaceae bacterium]|nr:alpha/beta hydrolase [Chloroflexaceae bacterium]